MLRDFLPNGENAIRHKEIINIFSSILHEGMVELVPASETLRKIQVEYGVTGSFKDKPLAEWLRKYNPTEEEYEKVTFSVFF